MSIWILIFCIFEIIIASPSCKVEQNFCKKCNPVTKLCEKCEYDIMSPDQFGGCQGIGKCIVGKNYCNECDEDSILCKKCETGYYPDNNGACSYTNNCQMSYRGKCLKCKNNNILIGSSITICKAIYSDDYKHCEKIDSNGECSLCEDDYYLNEGDKKCIGIKNCKQSMFGTCNQCIDLYYYNKLENKCVEQIDNFFHCIETVNGKNCDKCEEGYYLSENKTCISVNYCAEGDSFSKCKKCMDGYILTKYKDSCTKEPNCYMGDRDLGICTQCDNFYYIDFQDGKCKSNQDDNDFKYCTSADEGLCNKCVSGTFLGKDHKCSFSNHCISSDKAICYECIDGYHLGKDNKCTNIDKCLYSDNYGDCLECEEGYYYNKKTKLCEVETDAYKNCKVVRTDGIKCETCRNGFYLNMKENLCYSNKEPGDFYKCTYTDVEGAHCISCEENYYIGQIDHKCSKIDGCEISENEDKCIQCDSENYCLDVKKGNCINNTVVQQEKKFYYKCNQTNEEGNGCNLCINGFTLDKRGLCVNEDGCEEKKEEGGCLKCKNTEENLYKYCLNSEFGCIENFYDGCEICSNILDFDECVKCYDGYVLNDDKICVKN